MGTQDTAKLVVGDQTLELPIIEGTEHERAIDIQKLRKETGMITYDPGYGNTGACESTITYVDGEKGELRYRGYPIEDLADKCSFLEVAYMLIYGELPTAQQKERFRGLIAQNASIHKDMVHFFEGYPIGAHPMSIMSSMVTSLSSFSPSITDPEWTFEETAARLIAKVRGIAAFSYKQAIGEPFQLPNANHTYCQNFLNMMFQSPTVNYEASPTLVRALEKVLILHADHEQNCSTSAVRLVGSSRADLYASMGAGVSALWGPLHGGASQAAVEMLMMIEQDDRNIQKYVAKAKDKDDDFRLMGFGHRVYKNYDPRARILKATCDEILEELHVSDPLLDIAKELESIALSDEYFVSRNLYPNVDFYAGIIYRALGFPVNMFTVLFTIGRMPGWIAHWREASQDPAWRIGRPRQVFQGYAKREIVPIDQR